MTLKKFLNNFEEYFCVWTLAIMTIVVFVQDITLTQDGQLGYEVLPGDRVDVELARDKCVRTITMPERTFLDLVQEKLGWGQSRPRPERE